MSIVNVTSTNNTVSVTESGTVIIGLIGVGPQGPPGSAGAGFDIDTTARVDKSVVYYDAAAAVFKADTIWTTSTLSDGGNF
jgi:hypothetical protein